MSFRQLINRKVASLAAVGMFVFALDALVLACGQNQSERKPEILPVDSLEVEAFSLVSDETRCGSLQDFVNKFSAQHVSGVYQEVKCDKLDNSPQAKLSFKVVDPSNSQAFLGGLVVYLSGTIARFLICVPVAASTEQPDGTYCTDTSSAPGFRAIPSSMKTDQTRVQDFIVTLEDYLLK